MRRRLLAAVAGAALSVALPVSASAAESADLEARLRQLESALAEVKAELAATKAEAAAAPPSVIQIPTASATAGPAASAAPSDGFRIGAHTVKYGGFVKADAIVTDFQGGDPTNSDLVREFLLPGAIPVGGAGERETHLNARQTRFWLTTDGVVEGRKVGTRIEFDFQALPGAGDQRTTSPSNPALRRAFVTVDGWLFGQEWSTFQNVSVLPESADYIGPSEGTVFVRQAQVRYTKGPFSISLENPETTITPFGGETRIVSDDAAMPDVATRFDVKRPFGDFAVTGLVRQLAYKNGAIDGEATGWGVSASGKVKVGKKDDLRFMLTHGEGIGRYVGVNFANDAVARSNGDLVAIPLTAGFVAYRHLWTDRLRSSLIWSTQAVNNDRLLVGGASNASARSWHVNLIWTPFKAFDVGVEVMGAERELESGLTGELTRVQAFVKYGFQ